MAMGLQLDNNCPFFCLYSDSCRLEQSTKGTQGAVCSCIQLAVGRGHSQVSLGSIEHLALLTFNCCWKLQSGK